MSFWRSIGRLFPSRTALASVNASLRLTQAYHAVFRGNPTHEDQEIVLADLMNRTGWNTVLSTEEKELAVLASHNAKRGVFAHIFGHISLSPEDVRSLENAARFDATVEQSEDQLYG